MTKLLIEQENLESNSYELGIQRNEKLNARLEEAGNASDTKAGSYLISLLLSDIIDKIDIKIAMARQGLPMRNAFVWNTLQLARSKTVAYIALSECINYALKPLGNEYRHAMVRTALAVMGELRFNLAKTKDKVKLRYYTLNLKKYLWDVKKLANYNRKWLKTVKEMTVDNLELLEQDKEFLYKLGSELCNILIEGGIVQLRLVQWSKTKQSYALELTNEFTELLGDKKEAFSKLSPIYTPMVVEPLPWGIKKKGGYMFALSETTKASYLVGNRNKNDAKELYRHDMPIVYRCVNTLQSCGYVIDKDIVEMYKRIDTEGDNKEFNIPFSAETVPFDYDTYSSLEEQEKGKYAYQVLSEEYKEHCRQSTVLKFKRMVGNAERWVNKVIYFPVSLCFRGRAYTLPAELGYQQDKYGKALLRYEQRLPMTEDAVNWLGINLANHCGQDKKGHEDRVRWVFDNFEHIQKSVERPFDYQWWTQFGKDSFIAFQSMQELVKVVTDKEYKSNLICYQDGTNNGLQHFGALFKDELTGSLVNLLPPDKQDKVADVYAFIADKLNVKLYEDRYNEPDYFNIWADKITRKFVKLPVMTLSYGVTRFGVEDQIIKFMRDYEEETYEKYITVPEHVSNKGAIRYITGLLLKTIEEELPGCIEILKYLQSWGSLLGKYNITPTWITPSGFKVIQRYQKATKGRVETYINNKRIRISTYEDTDTVDRNKHKLGLSPNFVHSLDASHLHLTVHDCYIDGITSLSTIHDSYGCHAINVPAVNHNIRNTFVDMHSYPLLDNFTGQLREQLLAVAPDAVKEIPELTREYGNLDISKVLESPYFFT